MKIKLVLEDQDVWWLQNAIWIAALHEAESMNAIKPGELEEKKASAEVVNIIIQRYMQIHADVINQWARAQGAEQAKETVGLAINAGKMVMDTYNIQMRRIRGEAEKSGPPGEPAGGK